MTNWPPQAAAAPPVGAAEGTDDSNPVGAGIPSTTFCCAEQAAEASRAAAAAL